VDWWTARAYLAAGEVGGSTDEGANDLIAARDMFAAMGAPGWVKRTEDTLRRHGRRWPAVSGSEWGALTAREAEILSVIAGGATNADVARALVLSENTVARHLTRINRKLGVSNRAEAIAARIANDE
jgi:DNA-binding CsgD family transcriptional regulator